MRALHRTRKNAGRDAQVTGKLLEDQGAVSPRKHSDTTELLWTAAVGVGFTAVYGNDPQPPL